MMDRSVENTMAGPWHFSLKVAFSRDLLYRTSLENYILLSFNIVKKDTKSISCITLVIHWIVLNPDAKLVKKIVYEIFDI